MSRLLKAELFKLRKNKTFIVLCIVIAVFACMTTGITKLVCNESFLRGSLSGMTEQQKDQYIQGLKNSANNQNQNASGNMSIGVHVSTKDLFNPKARDLFYSSFGSGLIEIFLSILVGAMVAKEYSSGTIKNTLAYGKKRWQYYVSKVIVNTVGGTILLAITVGISTLLSCMLFGWGDPFTFSELVNMLKTILGCIVMIFATSSLLVLIATFTKSNGGTIAIGIILLVIGQSVLSELYLLEVFKWLKPIYNVTITHNWAEMIKPPVENAALLKAVFIGAAITVISSIPGIALIKNQDIK
ncbi:ABC transporter permease [Inconstantimicrobium mannanitabidum]|uniref:Uncharacterized protein n=1 Tax=Inconstantimicrobium mannanitabidum TaxID=1604901 RepID=A0ACB5RG97_9CLOT|nr:ABC transporter permease [Clostridium sp. TW13]GKX68114.1 hypothetical protein rsdtw13_33720 [Clostridium sp. TW13]